MTNMRWTTASGWWQTRFPFTPENLQYLTDLQGLSDDLQTDHIDWNQIVDSMAKAIAAGKRPSDASMITARRQMEEARLVMTSEASVAMEKSRRRDGSDTAGRSGRGFKISGERIL